MVVSAHRRHSATRKIAIGSSSNTTCVDQGNFAGDNASVGSDRNGASTASHASNLFYPPSSHFDNDDPDFLEYRLEPFRKPDQEVSEQGILFSLISRFKESTRESATKHLYRQEHDNGIPKPRLLRITARLCLRPKRFCFLALCALVALLLVWMRLIHTGSHISSKTLHDIANFGIADTIPNIWKGGCQDVEVNMTSLIQLQDTWHFGDELMISQREIAYSRNRHDVRRSVTRVAQDLLPPGLEFSLLNLQASDSQAPDLGQKCIPPLTVELPSSQLPAAVNASHLLFGISTSKDRLDHSVFKEWSYWLTDGNGNSNGGGLHLLLQDASEEDLKDVKSELEQLGIDACVERSDGKLEMAVRYLSLVPTLYKSPSRSRRRWLVLCDDDTFFPSIDTLQRRLEDYDHTTDMYVGTFSEDVNNIDRHGSQAFGGAGVFITPSLASQISTLFTYCSSSSKVEEADSGWGPQGDILLRQCIYDNTETHLTVLRDLHQLDFDSDGSGFYESGLQPLSLHHYKGGMWHLADPIEGVQVSRVLGEDAFLMRFRTSDDWIISNGYSVASYPKGIDFDLGQVEHTFGFNTEDREWNMDFMLGPMRKSLSRTGRKIAWQLIDTTIEPGDVVRQVYLKKKDDERWLSEHETPRDQLDSILILVWRPSWLESIA